MTYEQYRKDLIKKHYDDQLKTLVNGFDPKRNTVILLPGGMGSRLKQSEHQHPKLPNEIKNTIWIDAGIERDKDALKLVVDAEGKDIGDYVVGAHGPLSFFFVTPYDKLPGLARKNNWNYGVFGFDWRRTIDESASFFKNFILTFQERVIGKYGREHDPIPNLTIVCHSMGGLVCTYALRDTNFSGLGFHAVVTIGTPFYGTSTHQERYFVGVSGLLNQIYTAKTAVQIVASLPGPYALMTLPKTIYDRDGGKIGLSRYPQYDPDSNADADPYDRAVMRRWPKAVKDHWQYIADCKEEMIAISDPINSNIVQKFFNVRSTLDKNTAVELQWKNIDGETIDPDAGRSPLAGVPGPGDGTVPGWSAFHAHSKHRYSLARAKVHASLLEHTEVLTLIETIVKTGTLPKARKGRGGAPAVASKRRVENAVAAWVKTSKAKKAPPPALFDAPVKRGVLSILLGGEKPRMTRKRRK